MTCQANIHGPFNQTLFLGCSVQSFSVSAGFNEQTSTLTIALVEDPCATPEGSPKIYYDLSLQEQEWTDADPGFFGKQYDLIGTPVYFRLADFEFSGIVQSWEQKDSTSEGHPVYTINIVDPRQILEGTEVIIGHYTGSTLSTYNVLNVYGHYERGTDTACYPPTFGDSQSNENGMPWNLIKQGIMELTGTVLPLPSIYCWTGRIVYRGLFPAPAYGMGILQGSVGTGGTAMPVANYCLDISELPTTPTYYKISGTNVKLMNMLSTVCQDSGVDFFIELLPINIGFEIVNLIKIRIVDRTIQPDLNAISQFIKDADEGFVSANQGRESRNETVAKLVIGDFQQELYQKEYSCGDTSTDLDSCVISPFWGFQQDGHSYIRTEYDADGNYEFDANVTDLLLTMVNPFAATTVRVNEVELQFAKAGFESWATHASIALLNNPAIDSMYKHLSTVYPDIKAAGLWNMKHLVGHLNDLINIANDDKKLQPQDILALRAALAPQIQEDVVRDMGLAFNFISALANEYYGKKWMVRVDEVCSRIDDESGQFVNSREPSDGGWDETGSVLGLQDPLLEFFRLDDDRIQPFMKFTEVEAKDLDFREHDPSNYGIANDSAYVKAAIEPKWVFEDYENQTGPRAVLTIDGVSRKDRDLIDQEEIPNKAGGLIKLIKLAEDDGAVDDVEAKKIMNDLGAIFLSCGKEYEMAVPQFACVPAKSNFEVYGPWKSNDLVPPPGKVEIVVDRGLAPWEYSGISSMNTAATFLANEAVTEMVQGEMGSVTIAGYPTKPLFGELLYSGNSHLYENRTFAGGDIAKYEYGANNLWTGTQGPPITGIDVEVAIGGIQTTYAMRTYTPKFGLFAKQNAERLKTIGRLRSDFNKKLKVSLTRNQVFANKRAKVIANQPGGAIAPGAVIMHGVDAPGAGIAQREVLASPHAVLAGAIYPFGASGQTNYRRSTVMSESWLDMALNLSSDDYDKFAIMSLDGLLRPISLYGDGGLPRFGNTVDTCQKVNTAGAQPPVRKGSAGSTVYDLDISQSYLNPLAHPDDTKHGTSNGHDFDILARGTGAPTGTMVMPIAGIDDPNLSDYRSDYRFLGMRGPIVMHGWGYDLNGKPVPNKADTESATSGGTFVATGLRDEFLDDYLRKSHTWPVGPVDLRWDRGRGVWTAPPAFRMIVGKMSGTMDIDNASGTAYMTQGENLYDADGNAMTYGTSDRPFFTVTNITNSKISSGSTFLAYYDPESCEYYPLAGGSGAEIIRFRTTQEKAYGANVSGLRLNQDLTDTDANPIYLMDTVGQWGVSMSGAKGWGYRLPDTENISAPGAGSGLDAYEIGFIEAKARYIGFKLKEQMGETTAGQALAEWDSSASQYWGDSVNGQNPWVSGTGIVKDTQGIYIRALSGASGIAVYHEKVDEYQIVRCQTKAEWIRFTLNGTAYTQPLLDPAGPIGLGSNYANILAYGGDMLRVQDPTLDNLPVGNGGGPGAIVFDNLGASRLWSRALAGATGIAWLNDTYNRYNIVECQTKAEFIQFESSGTEYSQPFSAGPGPYGVKLKGYSLGQQPAAIDASINVVDPTRIFKRHLASGQGLAVYDEYNDRYVIVEAEKKAEHIVFKTTGTACYKNAGASWDVQLKDFGREQRPAAIDSNVSVKNKLGLLAPGGATGIATYDNVDDEYHVTSVQTLPYSIIFRTTTDFGPDSSPFVKASIDTGFTNSFSNGYDTATFSPTCITEVKGIENVHGDIVSGATGLAILTITEASTEFVYTVVEIQKPSSGNRLLQFKLDNELVGASIAATAEDSYGGPMPTNPITVYDRMGKFLHAPANATGIAVLDPDDKWVIINCQLPAEGIKFNAVQLAAGTTGSGPTVSDFWRGLNPTSPSYIDPCKKLVGCVTGDVVATWNQEDNVYVVTETEDNLVLAGKTLGGDAVTVTNPSKITFGDCFKIDSGCTNNTIDPKYTETIYWVHSGSIAGNTITLHRKSGSFMMCSQPAVADTMSFDINPCTGTAYAITDINVNGCYLDVVRTPFYICGSGATTTESLDLAPVSVDVLWGAPSISNTNVITFPKKTVKVLCTGADATAATATIRTQAKSVVTTGTCVSGSVNLTTETVYVFCNSGASC